MFNFGFVVGWFDGWGERVFVPDYVGRQSQRDCVLQPRVASSELPWERFVMDPSTSKRLRRFMGS
jgi:hypothetical protein